MNSLKKKISVILILTFIAPFVLNFIPSLTSLTVMEALAAEATLKNKDATLGIASSPEFIYIENYSDDKKYTYSSSDEKVATVSENGMIKGVTKGKATITVKEDGKKIGSIEASVVAPKLAAKVLKVGLNNSDYMGINYMNYNATYKYKSSDTKVAKADKYGYISGVKLGKATITVTETYKKKDFKLGTFTVNVVNAEVAEKEIKVPVSYDWLVEARLKYENYKATYKFKSSNSKTVKVDKGGGITGLKKGSATITVTETYNKKSRKVGTIKVNVVGASIDPDYKAVEVGINSSTYLTNAVYLNFQNYGARYSFTSADEKIVAVKSDKEMYADDIVAVGLGSTTITIYEEFKGKKELVGTATVTVKEYPVTELHLYSEYMDQVDGKPAITYIIGEDYSWNNLKSNVYVQPYEATTPIVFTSGDETIATVDKDGNVTPIAVGTAVITITCGEFSEEVLAVVKAEETEGDYDEDYIYDEDFDEFN